MMKDNLQRESLAETAHAVNLSASRLRHLFKDEIGLTPAQYVRALRKEEARRLLETTFLRVKEIALIVGMSDSSHLVREFKKDCALTPAQYRASFAGRVFEGGRAERQPDYSMNSRLIQ